MGEIINFSKRLPHTRRGCKSLNDAQRSEVATAQKYVRALGEALTQELDLIGDDKASDIEKDEAFASVSVLEMMLRERLAGLKRLKIELLGDGNS
jgi:hypothetical protein